MIDLVLADLKSFLAYVAQEITSKEITYLLMCANLRCMLASINEDLVKIFAMILCRRSLSQVLSCNWPTVWGRGAMRVRACLLWR